MIDTLSAAEPAETWVPHFSRPLREVGMCPPAADQRLATVFLPGDAFKFFMIAYLPNSLCGADTPFGRLRAGSVRQTRGTTTPDARTATAHVGTAALGCPVERSSTASAAGTTTAALTYENIFRIVIMQFIDAHSFDVRSVKKTCVHIVHPDGRLIPFDTYNLFYRDHLERIRLAPLRQNAQLALAAM